MILKNAAALLVAILISGCSDDSTMDSNGPVEVRGVYESGFERSIFSPCESTETWWVAGSSEVQEQYHALDLPPTEAAYVRWIGYKSEPGDFGHMGMGDYEFTVIEVIEMRAAEPGECSAPGELGLVAVGEQGRN